MFNNLQNKYIYKNKIRKLKKIKFQSFKKVMSLESFTEHYIKDFYTAEERESLRRLLNVSPLTLQFFLMKQYVLRRAVERKYYLMISQIKIFTRKFRGFTKKMHFNRKNRRKKLKIRMKCFFRINYENILFYLTIFDKKIIIKPFNFLGSLIFYKKLVIKKLYKLRKSKKKRFNRFKYKYFIRRRRKRKYFRRRIKYLRYRVRKKFLMKRFKRFKIKRMKNFFKLIAFFKNSKQKKSSLIDNNFKIKSGFYLPFKLLKFNFNKIHNSYYFSFNFNQRKKKIKIFNNYDTNKIIFDQTKIKLYNNIKLLLKNRFINDNKKKTKRTELKKLIFFNKKKKKINFFNKSNIKLVKTSKNFESISIINSKNTNTDDNDEFLNNNFLIKYLKNENNKYTNYFNKNIDFPDYVVLTSFIKNNINLNFSKLQLSKNMYNLIFIIKFINKLSKKILFLKIKLNKFYFKQKKKLSHLFLKLLKINTKLLNKFNKYKKIIYNLVYIIKQLKIKLKEFILNFYIIYNILNKTTDKSMNNSKVLKKVFYYLKKRKFKYTLKNKKKLIFSLLSLKKRFILSRRKDFIFSYSYNLIRCNRRFKTWWRKKRLLKKKYRKQKKAFFRHVNKTFNFTPFYLYKNYFNKRKFLKNDFFSHFCNKKFKYIYLNFLKKLNMNSSQKFQINKNVDFLQKIC